MPKPAARPEGTYLPLATAAMRDRGLPVRRVTTADYDWSPSSETPPRRVDVHWEVRPNDHEIVCAQHLVAHVPCYNLL